MSAIFVDADVPFPLTIEYVSQANFDAAGMANWLTHDEQERFAELQSNAVTKRSRQWLLGRYAAKLACRRWLEERGMSVTEWTDIQINNTANGMPRLAIKNIKESPTLSIAHSGDEAIAAVAEPGCRIGVDIESNTPRANLKALAKRICSESERSRWFNGVEHGALTERFTQLWLAKEAVAKSTGEGLRWKPGMFEVVDLSATTAHVQHNGCRFVVCFESSTDNMMYALACIHT